MKADIYFDLYDEAQAKISDLNSEVLQLQTMLRDSEAENNRLNILINNAVEVLNNGL